MIRVFPSRLEGEPIETHHTGQRMSVGSWLGANAPKCDPQFLTMHLNGGPADLDTIFGPDDVLDLHVEPRGTGAIIAAVVAVAVSVAVALMMPTPTPPRAQRQGRGLDAVSIEANTARYGEPIPEVFGSPPRIYPDLILPQRTYYEGNETSYAGHPIQWAEALLCLGKGQFEKSYDDVFIGDTRAIALGDDVEMQFYEPGVTLAGSPYSEWWHTNSEVGFTSRGDSGQKLGVANPKRSPVVGASTFTVNGNNLSIPAGAGVFPADWDAGTVLILRAPYPANINGNTITTAHGLDHIVVEAGMQIEIDGPDTGVFEVGSYVPAGPGTDALLTLLDLNGNPAVLTQGDHNVAIGPVGFRYLIQGVGGTQSRTITTADAGVAFTGFYPLTSNEITVSIAPESLDIGWVGPFAVTPPGEACTDVEVDIVFPGGLRYVKSSGSFRESNASVEIEWREIGQSAWNRVSVVFRDATADARAFTRRIVLPAAMEVEVRARHSNLYNDSQIVNECNWTGLRGKMVGAPERYEGVTLLGIRIRTGDRVSAQSDNKVWLRATRMLPSVEDPDNLIPTRDIMPAVLHMLNAVGYGRERVDMAASLDLHTIWNGRGDTWNYSANSSSTVKTLANHALKAGFAELVVDRGLAKPVRDAKRSRPEYIYSPQEFVDYPTMTTKMVEPDEVDGVDVEYVDEQTGRTETIKYRLPGDAGRRAQKVSLIGVTNWLQAWRIAARHRRTLAYRRTTFKGTTELHALNSSYMSYDRIQDGIPGYGQSGFVVALDGLNMTVSEPLDWSQDANRVVAFRQMDGKVTEPIWAQRGPTEYDLLLSEPPPIPMHYGGDNRDPTMFYFGTMTDWSHEVLVTAVRPGANNRVGIEGFEYDERVYIEDNRDPLSEVILTSNIYDSIELTSTIYPIEFSDTATAAVGAPVASYRSAARMGQFADTATAAVGAPVVVIEGIRPPGEVLASVSDTATAAVGAPMVEIEYIRPPEEVPAEFSDTATAAVGAPVVTIDVRMVTYEFEDTATASVGAPEIIITGG